MARERLPLIINGVDFSRQASRLAYSVTYEERMGNNSTLLLSGDEYLDMLTDRPIITWELNMLWLDELQALRQAIRAAIYVPVYCLDIDSGAPVIGQFHGSIATVTAALVQPSRTGFADGAVLTLRSR